MIQGNWAFVHGGSHACGCARVQTAHAGQPLMPDSRGLSRSYRFPSSTQAGDVMTRGIFPQSDPSSGICQTALLVGFTVSSVTHGADFFHPCHRISPLSIGRPSGLQGRCEGIFPSVLPSNHEGRTEGKGETIPPFPFGLFPALFLLQRGRLRGDRLRGGRRGRLRGDRLQRPQNFPRLIVKR